MGKPGQQLISLYREELARKCRLKDKTSRTQQEHSYLPAKGRGPSKTPTCQHFDL